MHRNILHQSLKIRAAGGEIRLAVDFHKNTELAASMDVVSDHAFGGYSRRLLLGGGEALFSQNDDCLFDIALGFDERIPAVHHSCSGLFAELLDLFRVNVHE